MVSETLLCLSLLLREDAQAEVSILVGLKCGGDDQVLPRRKPEPGADLPQVDEGLGASLLAMRQEEVFVQVDVPLTMKLMDKRDSQEAGSDD